MRRAYINYIIVVVTFALLVMVILWPRQHPLFLQEHYTWNDWGGLAPTFGQVGRHFDYASFRRSDNVEDVRPDGAIAADEISIQDFRAAYARALNRHQPLPSIMRGFP